VGGDFINDAAFGFDLDPRGPSIEQLRQYRTDYYQWLCNRCGCLADHTSRTRRNNDTRRPRLSAHAGSSRTTEPAD
jgi:hypothetical protein